MAKESKILKPEEVEMIIIFDWIRHKKLDKITFHIANERKTSPQRGALLKRMGVLAGVSDVFMARAKKGYHGLFIEVKAKKGKPTKSQLDFIDDMREEGYMAELCYGAESAIQLIEFYLYSS